MNLFWKRLEVKISSQPEGVLDPHSPHSGRRNLPIECDPYSIAFIPEDRFIHAIHNPFSSEKTDAFIFQDGQLCAFLSFYWFLFWPGQAASLFGILFFYIGVWPPLPLAWGLRITLFQRFLKEKLGDCISSFGTRRASSSFISRV